jgi:hypothetical protein
MGPAVSCDQSGVIITKTEQDRFLACDHRAMHRISHPEFVWMIRLESSEGDVLTGQLSSREPQSPKMALQRSFMGRPSILSSDYLRYMSRSPVWVFFFELTR